MDQSDNLIIKVIDQRLLPFEFRIIEISSLAIMADAIKEMVVRGAGLIGVSAGYGMYLAALEIAAGSETSIEEAGALLIATRPTAVNLEAAVEHQIKVYRDSSNPVSDLLIAANRLADEDVESCRKIGLFGLPIIEEIRSKKAVSEPVNILTHCNAGWLAFVDYGSAISPIYAAHDQGMDLKVWVDETRPRNQGARLTAWELSEHGIQHSVISDNCGGHLMQRGMVDIVIVGADRVTRYGDVANKIGTYLKALAAADNQIPFYVAFPSTTIDWNPDLTVENLPIELRSSDEVSYAEGVLDGVITSVRLTPASSGAANYGFDVTPSKLITGLITENGVCEASEAGIRSLHREGGNYAN